MKTNIDEDKALRIIITSDVHHTPEKKWYGVESRDRVQLWVESIKKEHERMPIDLLIFAGDASLDHYLWEGSFTSKGESNAKVFADEYVSQLPDDIKVFVGAGNHELYNDEQWREYTGNGRQGAVAMKEDLFIFLDTFRTALEPNFDGELARYSPVDVEFLTETLSKNKQKRVWLISHYFDCKNESEEFKRIVREESRIKGLFAGHAHQCSVVLMGAEYGNKTIAQTGQFSYSFFTAFPSEDPLAVENSFWGFRELMIYPDEAYSNYIICESDVAMLNGKRLTLSRRISDSITYEF